ncbi:GNAT family N-acetyltransferase [Candidatus Pelagibacter sp.]|nr:GNAT family N-acetyltransferase [Candidatus Pelagibacter sp.]|tara:strand:- start:16 stop:474 length:459 start_codon:yes stop_codon:yes gene_type:complete
MPMVIREAKLRDLKKTFQWANDKDVIRNSLNRNSKVNKSEHLRWFKNYLKAKKKMIFIGTVNRKPVGMVRLDYTKMRIFISYLIDTKSRKKGLGFEMLKSVVDNIKRKNKGYIINAEVKKINIGSNKIFKKLGFIKYNLKKSNMVSYYKLKI